VLSRLLGRWTAHFVTFTLGVLALLALVETLLWWAFNISFPELAEIEGILLVWLGLLAGALGVHLGLHLGVDLVVRRLPEHAQKALSRVAAGFEVIFGALLGWYGIALWQVSTNTLPATGWSARAQYSPAVVAGVLIVVFALGGGEPDRNE